MATKNRDEIKSEINSVYVPTLAISTERTFMNQQADDLKFRKDVIQTLTVTTDNISTDFNFLGKDLIVADCITNNKGVLISPSNLDNGDEKYIVINKNAGKNIAFSGVTDLTEYSSRLTALTTVVYLIFVKNNITYVKCLSETVSANRTAWQNTTIYGEASSGSAYRVDEFGYLECRVSFRNTPSRALNLPMFILPDAYRMTNYNFEMLTNISYFTVGVNLRGLVTVFYSTGEVVLNSIAISNVISGLQPDADISFYFRIPLTL